MHNVSKYSTGSLGTKTIDPGRIPRILDHTVEELEVIKFDIDTWGKRPLWWLLKVKSEKVVIVAFRKYRCPLRNSMDCGVKKCLAVTSWFVLWYESVRWAGSVPRNIETVMELSICNKGLSMGFSSVQNMLHCITVSIVIALSYNCKHVYFYSILVPNKQYIWEIIVSKEMVKKPNQKVHLMFTFELY